MSVLLSKYSVRRFFGFGYAFAQNDALTILRRERIHPFRL